MTKVTPQETLIPLHIKDHLIISPQVDWQI